MYGSDLRARHDDAELRRQRADVLHYGRPLSDGTRLHERHVRRRPAGVWRQRSDVLHGIDLQHGPHVYGRHVRGAATALWRERAGVLRGRGV